MFDNRLLSNHLTGADEVLFGMGASREYYYYYGVKNGQCAVVPIPIFGRLLNFQHKRKL